MRLFVLRVGTAVVDVARFLPAEPDLGERYAGPLAAFLVQTDDGSTVLVDTGVSPEQALARGVRRARSDTLVTVRPEEGIVAQLAAIGVEPNDVDLVVVSHFDYDHCGGNRYFPRARFVVQAEHYSYAKRNPQRCPLEDWDLPGLRYDLVDGDVQVLPGVDVVQTPGHAPGHQSVIVRGLTETGTVILTGDASRTHREFEEERRGGTPEDEEIVASIRKLKAIRDAEGATLLTSHDMAAHLGSYRIAPAYYD